MAPQRISGSCNDVECLGCKTGCMVYWLIECLIHWFIDCLFDLLIHWLVHWFDCLIGLIVWFIDWLFICLIDWLIDSLIHWFIDSLIVWLVDWLVDLINWFIVLIPSSNSLLALRMIGWPLRYFDRNLGKPMGFPLWKIEKNTSPCAKWLYDQPGKLATSPLGSFFLNFEAPELEPDRPGTVRWPQPLKP